MEGRGDLDRVGRPSALGNREPGELEWLLKVTWKRLQAQLLEEAPVVGDRPAPLQIVIAVVAWVADAPPAASEPSSATTTRTG